MSNLAAGDLVVVEMWDRPVATVVEVNAEDETVVVRLHGNQTRVETVLATQVKPVDTPV